MTISFCCAASVPEKDATAARKSTKTVDLLMHGSSAKLYKAKWGALSDVVEISSSTHRTRFSGNAGGVSIKPRDKSRLERKRPASGAAKQRWESGRPFSCRFNPQTRLTARRQKLVCSMRI